MLISMLKRFFVLLVLGITFPILASVFLTIRGLVHLFLRCKYGNTFFGLMNGYDTVWDVHGTSRGQITILATFEYDAENNGNVYDCFVKQIYKPELKAMFRKAATRRRNLLGYNYFVEENPYEDLVRKMPAYESEEDVRSILSECSNLPIGRADDKLLEFIIGTTPIRFNGNGDEQDARLAYPLIMKMHHCLGDGIALMNFCIAGFGHNPATFLMKTDEDFRKTFKIKQTDSSNNRRMQLGKLLRKVMSCKFYHPLFGGQPDANLLHGKPLSGSKHLVWSRDIGHDYVQTVKNIKRRFDAVSFNNVLFAALSASFSEHYQKYDPENIPEYILNGIVLLPFIPKFEDLVTIEEGKVKSLDLSNKFIVAFLRIPITSKPVHEELLNLVETIKGEIKSLSESLDIYLTLFFMKYFAYIMPVPFCKFIMTYFDSTISVSNLPGHARLQMFHGGHMNDLYFWIPNVNKIGLGISMFTYDNRLRIGLIADQALIPNVVDVQAIVDNVFKYLDVLDKQTSNIYNNNN